MRKGKVDYFVCASRGRDPSNPTCREKGQKLVQVLEIKAGVTSNTLTSVTKDNYLLEVRHV